MSGGSKKYSKNKSDNKSLVSWNMQGSKWSDVMSIFDSYRNVDFVCMQECGLMPILYKIHEDISKMGVNIYQERGIYIAHYDWSRSDEGNSRCSLAVASRHAYEAIGVFHAPAAVRPVLGYKADGVWICTLHSNSSARAAIAARSLIKEVIRNVGSDDWMIAGDFNCQSSDVQGNWDIRRTDPNACRSKDNFSVSATQDIDWAVQRKRSSSKKRMSLHQGKNISQGSNLKSDHPAQMFQIWSTKESMDTD